MAVSSLLVICLCISGYFVYVANMPMIFFNTMQVRKTIFRLYQRAVLVGFSIVSSFSGRPVLGMGTCCVKIVGKGWSVLGAVLLFLLELWAHELSLLITIAMSMVASSMALMITLIFGDFVIEFPDIKGLLASVLSSSQLIITPLTMALACMLFTGWIRSVAVMIFF
jgi:hypothetical protein